MLILKRIPDSRLYSSINSYYNIDLLLLKDFLNGLHSEIGITCYKEWLEDNDDFLHSDNMGVSRELGNICIYSEYDEKEYPDECKLPVKAFAKMLDDWSEILKRKPQYVLIIRDGENLLIKGYEHEPSNFDKETTA